jgi:hypothetical protein
MTEHQNLILYPRGTLGGAVATVRTVNPGRAWVATGRTEVGTPDYRRDPPHVTRNDWGAELQREKPAPDQIAALPANAAGQDATPAAHSQQPVEPTSAYERRASQHKDNPPG